MVQARHASDDSRVDSLSISSMSKSDNYKAESYSDDQPVKYKYTLQPDLCAPGRRRDVSLTWFLRAPSSAGSEWHFGCSVWVRCCAGYLLAGHCRLMFLSLLCLDRQAKSEPGHTHPQAHQRLPPPHASALPPGVVSPGSSVAIV